jgi:hypothetical protein
MTGNSTLLIGDVAARIRHWLKRVMVPTAVGLALVEGWLVYEGNPGATSFALIAVGCYLVLAVWRSAGLSVPILPMFAVQHLIAYGLPIVVLNATVTAYSADDLTHAGLEVLLFCAALAAGWRGGMQLFSPGQWFCYGLRGFSSGKTQRLRRLGFSLIFTATGYLLLQTTGLLDRVYDLLPSGISILATTMVAAVSSCGFFLLAMLIGAGEVSLAERGIFWITLAANCLIQAASLLLSASTTVFASVMIGLFWGGGRVPWRYLAVVVVALAYLSLGKYAMRDRYWSETGEAPTVTLGQMPSHYIEWAGASFDALSASNRKTAQESGRSRGEEHGSLFERVNNLQNLLFVSDAIERNHIPALDGATYSLIPPLFIPRFLWPDKPRAHAGQVLLNVHFGRQDLASTEKTFIAWGLLPEAYGNFGPVTGAIALGLTLGLGLAWVEKKTARKLVLSLEGFLLFTFFLGLTNSFEMVGSVLATSLFQGAVTVVMAAYPFVARVDIRKLQASAA